MINLFCLISSVIQQEARRCCTAISKQQCRGECDEGFNNEEIC